MPALPRSIWRKLLYAVIISTVTLGLLLGSLEAGLRLMHYGYSPHFARRVTLSTGEIVWRENRWVTAPYFSPALVRRPLPFRLPEKKAPGTYRIFVLGSSAAMGDPEPSFSIGRVLETMLRNAYPDIHFEVVNAAVTAINSHLVLGIARDCAALEPDMFIVYEGHNEVIGPFGPSGVFTPFLENESAVRVAVWLKGTRTGQLLSAVARSLHPAQAEQWGGMQMFLDQQIALTDPRLEAVRGHFRENLLAIAEAAHDVGARTLVCTVLTNQRDFAPFLSQHRVSLTSEKLLQWESLFSAAKEAERNGDLAKAETAYRGALAIDDDFAELAFRYGRLLLQQGRDPEAQTFLQRALNLDTLRFRADASLNRVIRDLRSSHMADLDVVDIASVIAARSPHGLPGDESLYEHVHLTLRGAYDVASELYARIAADLGRRGLSPSASATLLDYNQVRLRLGFSAYEQGMIATELLNRFKAPPFTGQADHEARLQLWERRVESATALLSRSEAVPALREIYEQALAQAPTDWILERNAGSMFVARQLPAEALPLLEKACTWIDDDVDTLVALGWAHRALGHTAEANAAFQQARYLEPHYPGLPESVAHRP